jgi:alpha-beta hydrolase superfamily lysophospholipase/tryptophan-rich sensory protein
MDFWPNDSDLCGYRDVPADPRAAVLVLHGYGEHAGRHAGTMRVLADAGIAAYAYDHRGHGRSPGVRALVERFAHAVDDVLAMRRRVAAAHPHVPVFLLGASMGGLMAVRAVQRDPVGIAGVVLISPALAFGALPPPAIKALQRLVAQVAPALPVAELDLDALSRDRGIGEAYAADPLNHHGGVPARTAFEMVDAAAAALAQAAQWRLPAFIVIGDADRIAAPDGARRFAAAAAAADADITLREIPGGYHEPLNDPGGAGLVGEIAAWMLAHAATTPANAAAPARAAGGQRRYSWRAGVLFGLAINVAARLLGRNTGRYETIKRPWFAPPGFVFPIVWGINSTLSIAGNLRVLNAPDSGDRSAYLRLWAATWVLYISFGYAFFRRKSPVLGLLVTVNFLVLAILSFGRALRLDRRLGWTYVTLLPWLGLAGAVALSVALENPDPLLDPPNANAGTNPPGR